MHRFHPHLNPLPSRERDFMRDYAGDYKTDKVVEERSGLGLVAEGG